MQLRQEILTANGCQFHAVITADYGDKIYTFAMDCAFDNSGNMRFSVTEPQTISGVTGIIQMDGGHLTFDDQVLAFPLLADDQLTPVSAPWVFMRALRSGYLHSGGMENETLHLYIDDSYEDDAMQVEVWLDGSNAPVQAEILWRNRRILSITIADFVCL